MAVVFSTYAFYSFSRTDDQFILGPVRMCHPEKTVLLEEINEVYIAPAIFFKHVNYSSIKLCWRGTL